MEEFLGKDVIDGKVIEWDKMSMKELDEITKKLNEKEEKLREEIDKLLFLKI